jgi:hypothetical protein
VSSSHPASDEKADGQLPKRRDDRGYLRRAPRERGPERDAAPEERGRGVSTIHSASDEEADGRAEEVRSTSPRMGSVLAIVGVALARRTPRSVTEVAWAEDGDLGDNPTLVRMLAAEAQLAQLPEADGRAEEVRSTSPRMGSVLAIVGVALARRTPRSVTEVAWAEDGDLGDNPTLVRRLAAEAQLAQLPARAAVGTSPRPRTVPPLQRAGPPTTAPTRAALVLMPPPPPAEAGAGAVADAGPPAEGAGGAADVIAAQAAGGGGARSTALRVDAAR